MSASLQERPAVVRLRLLVRGVVQGVGFRPYVYRLARQHGLAGFVKNTSEGAAIEIEGPAAQVEAFVRTLPSEGPPLMRILSLDSSDLSPLDEQAFMILASEPGAHALAWVPADVAVCEECLSDTCDPANRRYEYPFTNCTNCGPRYSIILDVPYDRAQTTMADFTLCADCRAEYEDPANRRFHAQPNACSVCGPQLRLTDACGKDLPVRGTRSILETVVNLLRSGGIVAWKGLGGYQLACDARNDAAVQELRRRKHRNEKAFAVMVRDLATASTLCEISGEERALLGGPEKPIVLLRSKHDAAIAPTVAPGNPWLGVMLPYTPMHALLFRVLDDLCGPGSVLVMTSGNLSEEPIVIDEQDAHTRLRTIADLFVNHGRPIHTRVDDSVARIFEHRPVLLRRARGYTPSPLRIADSEHAVLAVGAQLKSTFCLTRAGYAILSQHLGDLENYETLAFFEQTLERMQRLFQVHPRIVAHDLHPAYLSTRLAARLPADRRIAVQHHHAHIAGCMAEHGLDGQVLGVAWDGTGYGLDGTVWGGEFLIASRAEFQRFAHLRPVLLAGGDTAVREPWRIARSYLRDTFDNAQPPGLVFHPLVPELSLRTLDALLEKRVQTIETTSCGRLFDAVASLLGLHQVVSFEGQAAMALEAIADSATEAYGYTITGQQPAQVDMRPTVRQIVDELRRGEPASRISARFHNTLASVAADVCTRMRIETGLTRVCLSGGCFQNVRLLHGCLETLRSRGFQVFYPQAVPANDGGIAFGQAAVACELLQRGV